jgi:hypothetical protein
MARKALGESSGEARFIATAPRRGYRFVAEVREQTIEAAPDLGPPTAAAPADGTAGRRPSSAVLRRAGSTAVVLSLAVAAALVSWHRAPGRQSGRVRSLAVLPLRDLSGAAAGQEFTDGLTDALITDLGIVSALRVISRQSAMHYRDSSKTLPQILPAALPGLRIDVSGLGR